MPFLDTDIAVRQVDDTTWELLEPVRYQGAEQRFEVPDGFHTDFASVPRVVAWLLPRYGRYTRSAILHDWLWAEAAAGRISRVDADGIFRRSMRELEVAFLRRWLMWAAVRLAGGPRELLAGGTRQLLQVLVLAVPGLAFVAVPVLVIGVALVLFWLAESLTYLVLRGTSRRRRVNRPSLLWQTT